MALLLAAASVPASSVFALRRIEVEGTQALSEAEVVAASGLAPGGRSIFLINSREIAARLVLYPRIAAAQVRVRVPHTVRIAIRERVPVAAAPFANRYALVDGTSVVVAVQIERPALPLLSERGGSLSWATPGQQIGSAVVREALGLLARLPGPLRTDLVHLQISRQREVFLYMRNGLEVRAGPLRGVARRLEAAPEVLRRLRAEGAILEYVDFSVADQVVIKPRAASP